MAGGVRFRDQVGEERLMDRRREVGRADVGKGGYRGSGRMRGCCGRRRGIRELDFGIQGERNH